ncbi:MAG: molybdopterin-dependent oxidoreductase [Acidobacteriota bacterium]
MEDTDNNNAVTSVNKAELIIEQVKAKDFSRLNRRELLKLLPLLPLGLLLSEKLQESLLSYGLQFSDWWSSKIYYSSKIVPTFTNNQVTPLSQFPYNSYDTQDPGIDMDKWTLTVEGLARNCGEYTLDQIRALPKQSHNIRHICIEGWDVIGNFGGTRLINFLQLVGADLTAKFIEVTCYDGYYTSYDMASCLHPQTLLCYEMYGQPLDRGHGAPLRIHMPIKLGYKSAKYLSTLKISNVLNHASGFWEDQGYPWFGGI